MTMKVPRAVSDLIADAVPQLSDRLAELRIKSGWASIVGADVARRTQPTALSGGCLTITVDNSPWLHELTLRGEELTTRVAAGFPIVRSLRFVPGAVATPTPVPGSERRRPVPLGREDVHDIEAATSAITDSTLAAAARRLLTTARQFPRP
jgi:predicted nucleic acid-binding Zn ribbon protein